MSFYTTFPAYTTVRPKGAMSRRARALAGSVYAELSEVAYYSFFKTFTVKLFHLIKSFKVCVPVSLRSSNFLASV